MQQMQTAPRPAYPLGPGGGVSAPIAGVGTMRPLGPPGPTGPPSTRLVRIYSSSVK